MCTSVGRWPAFFLSADPERETEPQRGLVVVVEDDGGEGIVGWRVEVRRARIWGVEIRTHESAHSERLALSCALAASAAAAASGLESGRSPPSEGEVGAGLPCIVVD